MPRCVALGSVAYPPSTSNNDSPVIFTSAFEKAFDPTHPLSGVRYLHPAGSPRAALDLASLSSVELNSFHVGSDDGCHSETPAPASTNGPLPAAVRLSKIVVGAMR